MKETDRFEIGAETVAEINEAGNKIEQESRILDAWKTITGRSEELDDFGVLKTELVSGKQGKVAVELHRKMDNYSLVVDDLSFIKGESGYDEAIDRIRSVYTDLLSTGTSVDLVVPKAVFNVDAAGIKADILETGNPENLAA